jgi:glycopeptide antibiotics resistance protein
MTLFYWPVVIIYSIILIITIIMYFTQMDNWSNRSYYNWMNFKRIFIPIFFLGTSLIFKHQGNQKLANIILFIPVGFLILMLTGGLIILMLYSKVNK